MPNEREFVFTEAFVWLPGHEWANYAIGTDGVCKLEPLNHGIWVTYDDGRVVTFSGHPYRMMGRWVAKGAGVADGS